MNSLQKRFFIGLEEWNNQVRKVNGIFVSSTIERIRITVTMEIKIVK